MENHPDDLDELLDSALNDFQNLNLNSAAQRSGDGGEKRAEGLILMPVNIQGQGKGLPDLKVRRKGCQ
ncbi:unnamed protein product [Rhodiola kirilowii]